MARAAAVVNTPGAVTIRYAFGDALLDPRAGELRKAGRPVALEPRAFHLLCTLVHRAGELVERPALLARVWQGLSVTPHSLTEAVSQLRRALDDDPKTPRFIETVHRRGYRFTAPVERLIDDDDWIIGWLDLTEEEYEQRLRKIAEIRRILYG